MWTFTCLLENFHSTADPLSVVLLSVVSVTHGQPWFENIKGEFQKQIHKSFLNYFFFLQFFYNIYLCGEGWVGVGVRVHVRV